MSTSDVVCQLPIRIGFKYKINPIHKIWLYKEDEFMTILQTGQTLMSQSLFWLTQSLLKESGEPITSFHPFKFWHIFNNEMRLTEISEFTKSNYNPFPKNIPKRCLLINSSTQLLMKPIQMLEVYKDGFEQKKTNFQPLVHPHSKDEETKQENLDSWILPLHKSSNKISKSNKVKKNFASLFSQYDYQHAKEMESVPHLNLFAEAWRRKFGKKYLIHHIQPFQYGKKSVRLKFQPFETKWVKPLYSHEFSKGETIQSLQPTQSPISDTFQFFKNWYERIHSKPHTMNDKKWNKHIRNIWNHLPDHGNRNSKSYFFDQFCKWKKYGKNSFDVSVLKQNIVCTVQKQMNLENMDITQWNSKNLSLYFLRKDRNVKEEPELIKIEAMDHAINPSAFCWFRGMGNQKFLAAGVWVHLTLLALNPEYQKMIESFKNENKKEIALSNKIQSTYLKEKCFEYEKIHGVCIIAVKKLKN